MKRFLLLLGFILLIGCSEKQCNESASSVYIGFINDEYYEFWFYDSILYLYDSPSGLSKLSFIFSNDSLFLYYLDGEWQSTYRITDSSSQLIILENNNCEKLSLVKYQNNIKFKPDKAFSGSEEDYVSFTNEILKRQIEYSTASIESNQKE